MLEISEFRKELKYSLTDSILLHLIERVKKHTFEFLLNQPSASEDGNKNNSSSNEPVAGTSKEMEGKMSFQKLLKDLPEKVSGQTAKNLSVPIAFVCLLHLANEKVWYNCLHHQFYSMLVFLRSIPSKLMSALYKLH